MSKVRRWSLIALTVLLGSSIGGGVYDPGLAEAQGKREINLEEDESEPAANAAPVTAGQMTEAAAQAKRLFDKENWGQAALMLKRVLDGETGDDEGNKQIAQYHLAIALYRLKFYQASYDLFRQIADNPTHIKFSNTLLWLAKLATQLPEPADIIGPVGKYSSEQVKRFDNPQQRNLYWQLNYMLGRYKYRNRKFEEAVKLFSKVKPQSRYFVKSQFFMGISYVSLRQSVPAVRAFQRIIDGIDGGIEGVEDESRMRDLANLSMARTFYSASVRLDQNNVPTISGKKLSAAVKYWNLVDVASEYWLEALFEQSWAYFMAGDFPRALGNIHTIRSPYFPSELQPEADILRAVIYFTTCQYDDTMTLIAKFQMRWEPIGKELNKVLKRFEGDGYEQKYYKFLVQVRDEEANLSPTIAPLVKSAMSDRQLLRHLEYVRVLDEELARFTKAPKTFQSSPVGVLVEDNISLARTDAVRRTGELVKKRYKRNLAEVREHLRNAQKIVADVTNAKRQQIDEEIASGQFTQEDAFQFGRVVPDKEHVLWPFDGEYWRDELGFYRQVVNSNCGSGS